MKEIKGIEHVIHKGSGDSIIGLFDIDLKDKPTFLVFRKIHVVQDFLS